MTAPSEVLATATAITIFLCESMCCCSAPITIPDQYAVYGSEHQNMYYSFKFQTIYDKLIEFKQKGRIQIHTIKHIRPVPEMSFKKMVTIDYLH